MKPLSHRQSQVPLMHYISILLILILGCRFVFVIWARAQGESTPMTWAINNFLEGGTFGIAAIQLVHLAIVALRSHHLNRIYWLTVAMAMLCIIINVLASILYVRVSVHE